MLLTHTLIQWSDNNVHSHHHHHSVANIYLVLVCVRFCMKGFHIILTTTFPLLQKRKPKTQRSKEPVQGHTA